MFVAGHSEAHIVFDAMSECWRPSSLREKKFCWKLPYTCSLIWVIYFLVPSPKIHHGDIVEFASDIVALPSTTNLYQTEIQGYALFVIIRLFKEDNLWMLRGNLLHETRGKINSWLHSWGQSNFKEQSEWSFGANQVIVNQSLKTIFFQNFR